MPKPHDAPPLADVPFGVLRSVSTARRCRLAENPLPLLAGSRRGAYLEDEHGEKVWKSAIRFHDVRHCFASILISQGHDAGSISRQMGHANAHITLTVYEHEFEKARSADKIRDALSHEFGSIRAATGLTEPQVCRLRQK
jgi:integrase